MTNRLVKSKVDFEMNKQDFHSFEQFISMFREKIGRRLKKSELAIISNWWHMGMNDNRAVKIVLERHKDRQSWSYYEKNIWPDYNREVGQVYKEEPTKLGNLLEEIRKKR